MLTRSALWLLAMLLAFAGCSGKTPPSQPLVTSCTGLSLGSVADRQRICEFYEVYPQVLNNKDTGALMPYLAETYKGSDGMNAAQIKAAIRNQITQFPWRDVKFRSFTASMNGEKIVIRHKMDVNIPDGRQVPVSETITWTRMAPEKWQITNWQHKE